MTISRRGPYQPYLLIGGIYSSRYNNEPWSSGCSGGSLKLLWQKFWYLDINTHASMAFGTCMKIWGPRFSQEWLPSSLVSHMSAQWRGWSENFVMGRGLGISYYFFYSAPPRLCKGRSRTGNWFQGHKSWHQIAGQLQGQRDLKQVYLLGGHICGIYCDIGVSVNIRWPWSCCVPPLPMLQRGLISGLMWTLDREFAGWEQRPSYPIN